MSTSIAYSVDLFTSAQQALVFRWPLAFAYIVGVGSGVPFLMKKLGRPASPGQRRFLSLFAVALILSTLPMLLDTFNVERRSEQAFRTLDCSTAYVDPECPEQATPGTAVFLRLSGIPIHFEPLKK